MVKRARHWFVECDSVSNEHLAELLDHFGLGGYPSECERRDKEGRLKLLWSVPSELIAKLKQAKRLDDRKVLHQFRFYVADDFEGTVYPADFVEKKTKTKKVKLAESDLRRKVLKRSSRSKSPF